jgi:hypothetical protein
MASGIRRSNATEPATSVLADPLGFLDRRFVVPAAAECVTRHAQCRGIGGETGFVATGSDGSATSRREFNYLRRLAGSASQ